jgi:hypothetical protein
MAVLGHHRGETLGTALPSPGFYPEISGFFEAVGIFYFYFKKSISGFYWDF